MGNTALLNAETSLTRGHSGSIQGEECSFAPAWGLWRAGRGGGEAFKHHYWVSEILVILPFLQLECLFSTSKGIQSYAVFISSLRIEQIKKVLMENQCFIFYRAPRISLLLSKHLLSSHLFCQWVGTMCNDIQGIMDIWQNRPILKLVS